MATDQRWKWAGIVSVVSIGGVLITDIVANVVGGYISEQIKQSWLMPGSQPAQAPAPQPEVMAASAPGVAEQPQAQMASVVSKPRLVQQDSPGAPSEPVAETVAAREPLPLQDAEPETAAVPDAEPLSLPEPQPMALNGTVEKVIDTGKLKIAGETVVLAGVEGLGSPYRDQFAKFIEEQGSQVRCMPSGVERHTCYVGNVDLALAALTNGAARLGGDANSQYQEAAAEARRNHRGIFQ
jgi:endonuclease YncB( thermonuclease family)